MARVISRRKAQKKRIRLRVAASLLDFLGVVGCILLILLCLLLLQSLALWIRSDFEATFSLIWTTILHAVIVAP